MLTRKIKVWVAVVKDFCWQLWYQILNFLFDVRYGRMSYDELSEGIEEVTILNYRSEVLVKSELVNKNFRDCKQDVWLAHKSQLVTDYNYRADILRYAKVYSDGFRHVSVYDENGFIHPDFSWYKSFKPINKLYTKPTEFHSGRTLHLSNMAEALNGNYAHWLIDVLSRYIMIRNRSSIDLGIDNLLIPAGFSSFRESIEALGIKGLRLIEMQKGVCIEFEELVCTSKPRGFSSNVCPGWILDGYRQYVDPIYPTDPEQFKKIYITRKDAASRKFNDEELLIEGLHKQGFRSIELSEYSLREKAGIFAVATDVVGLSGAGLLSIMFCKPDTNIIELYPSNFVNYLYQSVASYLGLNHHHFIFDADSTLSKINPYYGNFDLNVDELLDFVATVDSSKSSFFVETAAVVMLDSVS